MNFLRKRLMSFYYAFQGIYLFFKSQHNMYIHVLAGFVAVILGFWLQISRTEWTLVILCISLVVAAEMLNSVIEATVDMITPEWSSKAKYIKDVSAAIVLIIALGSAVIGVVIFLPYMFDSFNL